MILFSFGTRPEWIKIKPVIDAVEGHIPYKLLFTGQHVDLLSKISQSAKVTSLKIVTGPNRLDSIVSSIMNRDDIFEGISAVLVQGDTTSAFSIALAAFHRKIKVFHLEAGLRTYDKNQPYPEEFNRQAISRIADLHLCPTVSSKEFLVKESTQGRIEVVGNTVLDNLSSIIPHYSNTVVVTMHRRENQNELANWFTAIDKLAEKNKDLKFVLPLHPNPQVQKHKNLLKNVAIVEPMEYNDFIKLLSSAKFVITDSGGIQEESSFFNKKCIVCREKTERLEGVGDFALMCKSPKYLISAFDKINKNYQINKSCPYGDGKSSQKILEILKDEIQNKIH